ncbi:MAG: ATP-binding protein [Desulfomonilaceae bacterium]
MTEVEKLKQAIAHLEAQRDILGDDAVQAASQVLLQRLAALNAAEVDASGREHREINSQFVGRKAEFQVIKRRIENLVGGYGRIIALIGEAGIGKSRLVAEVRNHACRTDATFPLHWLEGTAAISMGNVASYGLFRQIIGRYVGIAEQDDKDKAWHKLQCRLAPLLAERSSEILPYIATMMTLHVRDQCLYEVNYLNGETISREIFRATEQLFESMAGAQPLILVLEDLQWIDESSVALLQHLLPLIYHAPILILGIGRPTVETPHAKLHEVMTTLYHNRYDEIRLAPLSHSESAKLVANLLHDEDHALLLTDKVHKKAEGNPFLIETTVHSLRHIDYHRPHSYIPKHLADKIVAGRIDLQGRRKLVTVMFADVAGFSSLSDKLDPEDVHRIMNGYFRILMDEIHECEGTVSEFRRDGMVAIFGAPIASEDHAQRACYASVAIQKALVPFGKTLKTRYGIDFKVRIGLNAGPVVVDAIGDDLRMDFTAQEDSSSLAAAMEGIAEPGTILVTEQTYRLTKSFFDFEPVGKLKTRGQEHPVETYRLTDKAWRAGRRSEREVYSEMIGRDQELSRLELQVLKAVNGEGSVVNVIGEAGIGKSRLLAELKKRDVGKRVRFLEGRAVAIGKNLSFHPLIDLIKNWVSIREDDTEKVALGKLESAVRGVCPSQADEVFPFVATMMGAKLLGKHADRVRGIAGEPLEKLVFKNVRELLISAAKVIPIVIVMEDLHWADASSLLLLDSVYGLVLTQKIVFINVFRPGYWDSEERAVENLKARAPAFPLIKIRIQPLDSRSSEALLDTILNVKGLQYGVRGQIIERTGGNPYFIEEIVRSLMDEGAVKDGDSGLEVTEKIGSVVIPETINEALMARIDKLDEKSRNVLKAASVIGRSFFHRILADVVRRVGDLDDKLAYLKQIQLIREQIRMDEQEYSFQHALAQEAVYESVPSEQRKQLHSKVAESIERIFNERLHEFYGTLAYHYGSAGNLAKTEKCLIKAGEEALKSAASNEALHYYQGALAIYRKLRGPEADPEKVATLEKNIALALFHRSRYNEAVEHFDAALNYYWGSVPKNSFSTAFRSLWGLVESLLSLYFPFLQFKRVPTQQDVQAVDLFCKKGQALAIIDVKRFFAECLFYNIIFKFDFATFPLLIRSLITVGSALSITGVSFKVSKKILGYSKSKLTPDDSISCSRYEIVRTTRSFLNGEWNEIAEYNEGLVNRLLRIGEVWDAAEHFFWHGLSKVYQGHFDTAKFMVSRLNEIAQEYESEISYLYKYILNTALLLECRDIDRSATDVERGIGLAERGASVLLFTMYYLKAAVHLLRKEMGEAGKSLDRAIQIGSEVTVFPIQLSYFYRNQFEYYLRLLEESLSSGHSEESSQHRRNAVKSGKMLIKACRKAATYRTDSCRLMGVYKWLTEDRKSAFKWWQKAIAEGERLGACPQIARTYAEIAVRTLSVKGDASQLPMSRSAAYREKARAMFGELGLHRDLEDLNTALSRKSVELVNLPNQ